MAKPKAKGGKSTDGHKLGKGKPGKDNSKVMKSKTNFNKNKSSKNFTGKKTFAKGNKSPFNKNNDANQKNENQDSKKSFSEKRKFPKEKESSTDEKEAKISKKTADPMVAKLMTIYETLRRKNTSKADRSKLIDQVLTMCQEKEHEVIHKHGTVRVLEMCVKFGTEEQRNKLFEVFEKNLMDLVTSKYGKFLVQKFIEYGSKEQKNKIIDSFFGHMKKLIRHKGASSIVDDIYDRWADNAQRERLSEEFYGPEMTIFKAASGNTIDDILKNDPTKKASILRYMKEQLDVLCQKEVVMHSIIHTALNNFFKIASDSDKADVVSLLKEKVVHILHTKDGASVAMNCIWYSGAKDRKVIVKSFKTFVFKICKEEYGHLVMLALFDAVDDTVLLKKLIFPEIIAKLDDLMINMYGRKVLLYLLKPRSSSYFAPNIIKQLSEGDANAHSKKDRSVRVKELCNAILPKMIDVIKKDLKDILFNKSVAILLLAILEVINGKEADDLLKELAKLISKPIKDETEDMEDSDDGDDDEEDEKENKEKGTSQDVDVKNQDSVDRGNPVCDACGHWVIKRIIQQDKIRQEKDQDLLFSTLLCDTVPQGCFADWATTNRGAFVLVSLMETNVESVQSRVKDDMKFLKVKEPSKGLEVLKKLL